MTGCRWAYIQININVKKAQRAANNNRVNFLFPVVLIRTSVMVHAVYEGIQRGQAFGVNLHRRMSEETDTLATNVAE